MGRRRITRKGDYIFKIVQYSAVIVIIISLMLHYKFQVDAV